MTSVLSLYYCDFLFSSRAEAQLRDLDVTRLQWLRGREELRAAIRGNIGFIFAINCTLDDIRLLVQFKL